MDHSGMDHGGMDMPSHGPMCNMNMLFTWDTTNLCIIFRWWHISSNLTLVFSLFGVMLLTAGYELVRDLSRRYEASSEEYMNSLPSEFAASRRLTAEESGLRSRQDDVPESRSLLWSGRSIGEADRRAKIVKAAFYAVQVFYSFFIMLLFMTYNGWVMFSVAIGAFVGYIAFGNSSSTKSVACH